MSDVKQRMLKQGAIEAGTSAKIIRAHLILSNQLMYIPNGSKGLFDELSKRDRFLTDSNSIGRMIEAIQLDYTDIVNKKIYVDLQKQLSLSNYKNIQIIRK